MTASVREQVLERIRVVLTNGTPAGPNVYRSRSVAITRDLTPAIVIIPESELAQPFGDHADRRELVIKIVILTRGDPADSLADLVAVPMHQLIVVDVQLRALLIADIRQTESDWNSEEADRTAGDLVMKYRCTYLTDARDLSAGLN